jgi:hypothetical protein
MQMIGALRLSRKGEYRAERAGRAPFGDHPSICRRAALSSRIDALSQMFVGAVQVTAVAKPSVALGFVAAMPTSMLSGLDRFGCARAMSAPAARPETKLKYLRISSGRLPGRGAGG